MHGISILVKCTVQIQTYKPAIFNLNNLNTYKSKNLVLITFNFNKKDTWQYECLFEMLACVKSIHRGKTCVPCGKNMYHTWGKYALGEKTWNGPDLIVH